jgi:hypothetical protein
VDGVAIDLHQHLWPEALLAGLARRTAAPRLRRRGSGWALELAGEPEAAFDFGAHDPAARAALAGRDGLELVAVAPSLPLGIEALAADEAQPLLDAFHAGVLELGGPFRLWGSAPTAGAAEAVLDRGAIGLCLPGAALASPEALREVRGVLAVLEQRAAPLLVHPGPAPAGAPGAEWWPALTAYVAEMSAAWHGWAAWGRAAHPRLEVVFTMLAGLAPLHGERLAARGGPSAALHDERTYFDVSSYGPRTVDAMVRVVGVDRLVHGSDRPVVEPPELASLGPSFLHAVTWANPRRLLSAARSTPGRLPSPDPVVA